MELDQNNLAALFPSISAQLRQAMSNLRIAADELAPAERRERDPELDKWAAILDQSYFQMLRLAESLTAAGLQEGGRQPEIRNVDLAEMVSGICEISGGFMAQRGLELKFVCPLEHHVCAVKGGHIRQLLYHLLSNAMKFTPTGGTITVELQRRGEQLELSVADTGCGIPDEKMETLFEGYLHPNPLAPASQGLGLGLALCQRIARDHDGTLTVKSRVGQGSRFTLTLPDWKIDSRLKQPPPPPPADMYREMRKWLADALPAEAFLVRYSD